MTRFSRLLEAFPDYDLKTLPNIPENWEDVSWKNDLCPSFQANEHFRVFVDYENPELREHQGARFMIVCDKNASFDVESDDWEFTLSYIKKHHV